jgi:hypothetical protein
LLGILAISHHTKCRAKPSNPGKLTFESREIY